MDKRTNKTTANKGDGRSADVAESVREFVDLCEPFEKNPQLFKDKLTGAQYCECHLRASKLVELATIDVPLDPEEQQEYRANREIVEDHVAFERMKEDAKARRTFSNIVTEFNTAFDPDHPIKIIGGQHRFIAIGEAYAGDIDELHGLKVYFGLNSDQRLDVQLISNTNIATSTDLIDRMHETLAGPELRDWCQKCGLLEEDTDFADVRKRGNPLTVRAARTILEEKDYRLSDGQFALTETSKFYRLTERIEFLFTRFSTTPIDKTESWWAKLKGAIQIRNQLTHPKQHSEITEQIVADAIKAIIHCLDALYRAIHSKPYPRGKRGLASTMTF